LWLVIDGGVFDVTDWVNEHPGGREILIKYGGRDATDVFHAFHLPRVAGRLDGFRVGLLSREADAGATAATLAFRELRKRMWKEGWFKPDAAFYAGRHAIWAALLAAGLCITLMGPGGVVGAAVGGAVVGLGIQQAAFIAHDAAHWGVTRPPPGGGFNLLAWAIGGPVFGASMGMWTEEHSLHHALTMRLHEDPQFDYLPLWLTSTKEITLGGYTLDWLGAVLIPLQHLTFLPVCMVVGRVVFHIISLVFATKAAVVGHNASVRFGGAMDLAGMALYWTWFGAVTMALPTTSERAAFVVASMLSVGILHVQLLLSHLATERFTADEEASLGFLEHQLRTSRNIDAPSWIENVFHGGLEFQIEHHLFPQLPRHKLAAAKPLVQSICAKHGLPYVSQGFFEAIGECLADLHRLGLAVATLEMG